ncbi:DUF6506 family protein [Enterobacter asburiae]|uniref:DUF6506 family protein n=1 Tax=Scandinavium sp. UTDF21-P1B TaxID=3446379 RepID=UPI00346A91A6
MIIVSDNFANLRMFFRIAIHTDVKADYPRGVTMFPNLKKWAFFYFSPDFSPEKNTVIHRNESNSCEFITVGFSPSAKTDGSIIQVAKQLVSEGVQVIEICGGFGPTWVTKISEAVGPDVPVGTVMYGPEHRAALLHIMKP